jgi:alanine-glyoxylate transaminase/serine-glyoxylate transaminase/serine-pyruvate transaminase
MNALGLSIIPVDNKYAANTLSAPYYPEGISGAELLPKIAKSGVLLAGGLLPDIKSKYFRIGHMGAVNQGDLLTTIGAIETGLKQCGYNFEYGIGLQTAINALNS